MKTSQNQVFDSFLSYILFNIVFFFVYVCISTLSCERVGLINIKHNSVNKIYADYSTAVLFRALLMFISYTMAIIYMKRFSF